MVVSDNGSELTSNSILLWADETRVEWHYIAPGKPRECQESCVWCRVDHYASENLSSKIMAKWVFAGVHSRGGIIQPFAV